MIKENRLRLNDEGTQVSNILFTSTSDDLDTTTEEFVLSYGDQELGENEKCRQAEVKSFDEMSTQTEVLTRTPKLKSYDASSQTDEFDYLFNTNKKVTDFGEEYFRNSDNKVLFYIGLPSYEILNFVFELVSPSASRRSKTLSPFKFLICYGPDKVEIECSFSRPSLSVEHLSSNGFMDISFLVDNYGHKIVSIYPLARS